MSQAHIFYSGMVQGVGFRYTVQRLAKDQGLFGWVKNLPDGRVEIRVEGQPGAIEQFVKNIDGHFGSYVRGRDVNYQESGGQLTDFRVIV